MDEQIEEFGIRSPLLDMFETKKEWVFELELPGIDEKTLEVRVFDHALVVKAERTEGYSAEDVYVFQERQFLRYFRSVPLPEGTDLEKMTAQFSNGVLRIIAQKGKRSAGTKLKIG